MSKVAFSTLKLKGNTDVKTIKVCDKDIEVLQYLPAERKNSLLELTIQNAGGGTVLNPFAVDALFHTYLVMEYTNLSFTDKQSSDIWGLYDLLEVNGIISEVISAIPEAEYKDLFDNLMEMCNRFNSYNTSINKVMDQLAMFAPTAKEDIMTGIEGIDLDKLSQIIDIADKTGYNV